ncbi:MAG TPA: glycosyltransferase family 9 protein [Candidatus Omnitrophota bacterium]|nr:glycosyltransferase family 9 protein [Candidatus Omnitrophota bacterium]HRY85311.1 glycosyltransferase family 9 protein [Candidatus Omnitrophota bacterium]
MKRYLFKDSWKRWLAGCFDAVGSVLFFPFRRLRHPLDLATVRKILVIRLDHIGDVVMSRPAIRALHKKFPHAEIDFLVTEDIAPLFESSRELHKVITAKHGWFLRKSSFIEKFSEFWRLVGLLKSGSYDVGIDLRGDIRNILLMFLAGTRYTIGYGITGGGFLLNENVSYDRNLHQIWLNLGLLSSFFVAQDNKLLPFEYSAERAQQFWKKIQTLPPTTLLPRVMVHMGSGYPSKRWPLENFKALIQKIDQEALAQIVLIGTEAEKDASPDLKIRSERLIDLRGKTDLSDLPVLLDVCDMFIGNDSGPAHIAAAQGAEVILLASGTNDIRIWHPWTERLHILQHAVPCSPCEAEICPVEGHPCVEEITVDQAFDAFSSVLSRLQKKS